MTDKLHVLLLRLVLCEFSDACNNIDDNIIIMITVWNDTIQYSPEAVRYPCTSCLLPVFDDA